MINLKSLKKLINNNQNSNKKNLRKKIGKDLGLFGDNDLLSRKKQLNSFSGNIFSISSLLPYRTYDEEQNIYFNEITPSAKDQKTLYTAGFILHSHGKNGFSAENIQILSNMLTNGLTPNLSIQFLNYSSPKIKPIIDLWVQQKTNPNPIYQEMAKRRMDFLTKANFDSLFSQPYIIKDSHLLISACLPFTENKRKEVIFNLNKTKEIFKSNLKNIGIHTADYEPEDLLSFLDEILNPAKDPNKSNIKWDRLNPLNTQHQSESTIEIKDEEILITNHQEVDKNQVKQQYSIRNYNISSYPDTWFGWENKNLLGLENNDFLRISCPMIQSLNIIIPENEIDLNHVITKIGLLDQKNKGILGRYTPNLTQQIADWKFIQKIISKGGKLFKTSHTVTLISTKETIANNEEIIKGIFSANDFKIKANNLIHLPLLLSSLPLYLNPQRHQNLASLNKQKNQLSWTVANIAPIITEYKGATAEPYVMLIGKRGQPVFFNPFYSPDDGGNFNVAVVGKPGSGKSVFMQDVASSIRGAQGRLFIIDDGVSFKNSSLVQDGKFIEINNEICINPFSTFSYEKFQSTSNSDNQENSYQTDILNFLTSIISQICKPIKGVNELERSIITSSIKKCLEKYKNDSTIINVAEFFEESCLDQSQQNIARNLKLSLRVFWDKYQKYFQGTSDIDTNNHLLVFELSNIKSDEMKDLKSVVMMTLMNIIADAIYNGDRKTRSSLIIDEAWDLLHGNEMRAFIVGYVRRVRKYGGNLITGTHSINDYYRNDGARAVLENSQWKIFLAQNRDSIDYLKKHQVISMDDKLEEALKSLKTSAGRYSEVLIYSNVGWYIGRLILDKFSVFLYTTKAEEVAKLNDLKKQGYSTKDAVLKISNSR